MSQVESPEPTPATPAIVAPVFIITVIVAVTWSIAGSQTMVRPFENPTSIFGVRLDAASYALVGAAIFGVPAMFWATEHRQTRMAVIAGLGALAGLIAGAFIGLLIALRASVTGGTRHPFGIVDVPDFGLRTFLVPMFLGAVAAAIYGRLVVSRRARSASGWAQMIGLLIAVFLISAITRAW